MRSDRYAVITGASAGIGKATARALIERGWHVVGVGRDPFRSTTAEAELTAAARGTGRFTMLRGDLSLMAEVRRVAEEVHTLVPRVEVLVNNAGGIQDRRILTTEGTEITFAANHLAPFLLTRHLMPLLKENAVRRPVGSTRVIAVSSSAHRRSPGFDWNDLQSMGDFSPTRAYAQAKLANILFTRELARRVAADGIVALAMHPGRVASNFASHGDETLRAHMASAATVPPEEPAETIVWLATQPEAGRGGGRYFHHKAEEATSPAAQDDVAAARLWTETEALLAELGHSPTPGTAT